MGKKEKLIARLKSRPKDFTFDETETLLGLLGYAKSDKGKTSGSRAMFFRQGKDSILLHRPHPHKELRGYQIKQLIEKLSEEGLI